MIRAPYASDPARSRGRLHRESESETRSVFQRDRDRIVHSGAFRRLKHKTQVFVYHEGDYFRTRLTHSLEVAQIARSICRSLDLDEDLGETVALAHDLGHTPFGHAGEAALNACMASWQGFRHNDQTIRVLTRLERRYAEFDGLNLCWESVEGVVKHHGPVLPLAQGEHIGEDLAALDAAWGLQLESWSGAEAQVAALADDIAYNNHDIDDGLRAGLFNVEDLRAIPIVASFVDALRSRYPGLEPRRFRHELIRRLIDCMITDLVDESRRRLAGIAARSVDDIRTAGLPAIAFSGPMQEQDSCLKRFLFDRMYRHHLVNRETSKAKRVVTALFELFMEEPNCLPTEWQADLDPHDPARRARRVCDYIAGMTDRYALIEYDRLFNISQKF